MRLKTLENQMRVFMNPYDYHTMVDHAESRRAEVLMRTLGEMGLRIGETTDDDFCLANVRESTNPDVDINFLPIRGKDTKDRDTEGKRRDVWVPADLLDRLETYRENEGFDRDRRIFMAQKRTLQREIEASRQNAAVATGNDDYLHVSAHDFRAYFATNLALREGVDIEIVMTLGGWVDRQSMDPYLNADFDDIIQEKLARAGVLDQDVDGPVTPYEELRQEIELLREAVEEFDVEVPTRDDDQQGLADFS